jgi:metallo-beta-lactamase family protein
MEIQFLGASGAVTGSCYAIRTGTHTLLLECGQIQGRAEEERSNRLPLPVPVEQVDAVVLSHAHIDHSGRLPLLRRQGYHGPVYTHHATRALCDIMLRDSAWLHEKDAETENRKRARKGLKAVEPLYTREDAEQVMTQFRGLEYAEQREILPGVRVRFSDAGHILGAAIVELWLGEGRTPCKLVFSGDLGYRHAPVMEDPTPIASADRVLMESTYGNRDHRPFDATLEELGEIFRAARESGGNVLIPAFAVGRTQDLLFLMAEHQDAWGLADWRIFLDSPMAIEATAVYARYRHLYGAQLFRKGGRATALENLEISSTPADSMAINRIESGAIVIAGSGMCTGGRIVHHLKHNVWRPECHVIIIGYQASGTLGRRLVDGAEYVRIWQEAVRVEAQVHTVGGLSAHADQAGLLEWYGAFRDHPPVSLVHGEDPARKALAGALSQAYGVEAHLPQYEERLALDA